MKPLAFLLVTSVLGAVLPAPDPYRTEIEKWRQQREERLRADDGWLAVAGLFWLNEGANTVGSGPGNPIALPAGSAASRVGVVERSGARIALRLEPGVEATLGGRVVSGTVELRPDTSGHRDTLALGRLRLQVIERGGRYGIRLRDPQSRQRRAFRGLRWFPVRPDLRVTARFTATTGKTIPIPNVLGQVNEMPSPGQAVFTIGGREYRLEPVLEGDAADQLMFIFRDATAGRETYPAGRFLYTPLPRDGQVVLDFNKAYSPPCAYTPHATCPLPPKQNRLAVRIEAGEKDPKLLH